MIGHALLGVMHHLLACQRPSYELPAAHTLQSFIWLLMAQEGQAGKALVGMALPQAEAPGLLRLFTCMLTCDGQARVVV